MKFYYSIIGSYFDDELCKTDYFGDYLIETDFGLIKFMDHTEVGSTLYVDLNDYLDSNPHCAIVELK